MIPHKLSPRSRANWSKVCAAALVATSLAVGGSAFGQGFSTTFDEGTGTYPQPRGSLSGQNNWDTNDAMKTGAASYVGQSDYVGSVTGYTGTSATAPTNFQGAVGGLFHGTGAGQDLPGATTVYVEHAFNLAGVTAYTFATDFDISYTSSTRDTFGFNFGSNFQTPGAAVTLFGVNFTPDTNNVNQMVIGYTSSTGTVVPTPPAASAILYNAIYRLRINVNVTARTFTATITSTQGAPTMATLGPFSTGTDPSAISEFAARWTLNNTTGQDTNGGFANAGTNALVFDNLSIAVPEPSTWAMLGAGLLCLAVFARRRVRA